jgi:DNA-binding transcriptional LysR family regulator
MTIEKQKVVDQITVTEYGLVLYREATRIIEDGNLLTQTYHRTSLTPGQDLIGQPASVVAICNVAWTAEVIAAYQTKKAEETAKFAASAGSSQTQLADPSEVTGPAA